MPSKELKLTGNCIKGSRPLLSFDGAFNKEPHLALLHEMVVNAFATPRFHPKSKPFVDHVLSFNSYEGKVWLRNYQIVREDKEPKLVEIGPRCDLVPVKVFGDLLGGETLWSSPDYLSPARQRVAKVSVLLQRQVVKKKAKESVMMVKREEALAEEDNLFSRPDENEETKKSGKEEDQGDGQDQDMSGEDEEIGEESEEDDS